ncbi:hypothetical protein HYC85_017198 [Camellia sinensis]|uniref:Sugar phosphate transporter domain-containing protein n=1 Tax=Camellia sinensis TaxID=4442 RepID=A0A7J7H1Z1_CAMSI|nr:hypothetical protein HYC85_017198 [Camellia sinensis]
MEKIWAVLLNTVIHSSICLCYVDRVVLFDSSLVVGCRTTLILKYINVAMVTVLKNVTNVITAVGEMYLFNKHHDNRVWVALFLMNYCWDKDYFFKTIWDFKQPQSIFYSPCWFVACIYGMPFSFI